jgi:uncharacterized protein YbjT (DUF2867 family)
MRRFRLTQAWACASACRPAPFAMKYVTCDFAPKNAFSRKLILTVAGSKDLAREGLAAARGAGGGLGAERAGAPAAELGPDEPVGPGDDETVELFEPDPPHAATANARIASDNAEKRRMGAMLALGSRRPILPTMDVAIAGGHGKIARRLARVLVARDDRVRGLIRNPDHTADLRADGAEPVLCDLEAADVEEVAAAIEGADAAVFAAGAGPGSGAPRKLTMDRDGAVKLLEAAGSAGVERYVIVSSVGAENPPPEGDDVFSVYLRAKAEADRALAASDRAWTIVRPGSLTDDPGTGRVRIGTEPFRGKVSRDNVAQVLDTVLHDPRTVRTTFYVSDGDDPVEQALAATLDA